MFERLQTCSKALQIAELYLKSNNKKVLFMNILNRKYIQWKKLKFYLKLNSTKHFSFILYGTRKVKLPKRGGLPPKNKTKIFRTCQMTWINGGHGITCTL